MLEKMHEFFDARLETYDKHMREDIAFADQFYPFTASLLPTAPRSRILDLGCGTGLELEEYFPLNPSAEVTGIDLAPGMLNALKTKFPEKRLHLILGSYFNVPLGNEIYDAAVSVESLHHFTKEEKIPLYQKLFAALKPEGYLILTDYFAASDEEEQKHRAELLRLRSAEGLSAEEFYHYDTPLTVLHETEAILTGGFRSVEVLASWENTYTLKASK